MIVHRTLTEPIKQKIVQYPVLFLTGPRQSGKTTLLRTVFNSFTYVNLERPDLRMLVQSDPLGFIRNSGKNVIFDEAQYIPELFQYIQSVVDEDNEYKFILSGSQNFLLNHQISQSLAGRVKIHHLMPFDYTEIAHYYPFTLEEYMLKGFYPRVYQYSLTPSDFYPSYIQTYIERDIRSLRSIENLTDFTRFVTLCAGRSGQVLNLSSLANDTGISVNTAKAWLSLLQASYIVFLVEPYYRNLNKRIIKSPKLYFYDIGLLLSLLRIVNNDSLFTHYMYGSLFENFVIADILKQLYHQNQHARLYYWKDSNGNEIDLIFEEDATTIRAIEIKAGQTFNTDYLKNFSHFKADEQLTIYKTVVYTGNDSFKVNDVEITPWQRFLQDFFKR